MGTRTIQGTNHIKIDARKIPDYDLDRLAAATIRLTEKFFEQPGVEEDFQAWKRQKRGEQQ